MSNRGSCTAVFSALNRLFYVFNVYFVRNFTIAPVAASRSSRYVRKGYVSGLIISSDSFPNIQESKPRLFDLGEKIRTRLSVAADRSLQ